MSKEQDGAADHGASTGVYDELPVDRIDPSPLNRKYDGDDDQRVLSLAADIEREGLIHPINVRVMPDDKYEIICGEGRWRAFRRSGLTTIPCIVRDCDEITAQIMRLSENIQRSSLDPLDEGEGIAALLALHHNDVEEVAARVKWDAGWVRRRAKLTNLSPAWREEIAKPDTVYAHIRDKITHMELLAPLPQETQDALLAKGDLRYKQTARDLRAAIALMMRRLDAKPWPYEFDKKTYSGSSGKRCESCLKRSGRKDGGLFDDLVEASTEMAEGDKSDLCLDPVCWQEKTVRFVKAQIEDYPDARFLSSDTIFDPKVEQTYGGKILPKWAWDEWVDGKETGAGYTVEAKGVFVHGHRIGQVIDIMLRDDDQDQEEDATRTQRVNLMRRNAEETARREEAARAELEAAIPETLEDLNDLLHHDTDAGLAAVLMAWGLWFGLAPIRYDDEHRDTDFAAVQDWKVFGQIAWAQIRKDVVEMFADHPEAPPEDATDRGIYDHFAALFGIYPPFGETNDEGGDHADAPCSE